MTYQALIGVATGVNLMGVLNAIADDRPIMAVMYFVGLCCGICSLVLRERRS